MTAAGNGVEVPAGKVAAPPGRGVEVDRIESALMSMWTEAGRPGEKGGGPGVTRACTLNLVVYTTPADDREQLDELLAELNERSPSRTLVMVANRAAREPRIDAYISMRCRLVGDSGKQVCGEEVTIEADGTLVAAAASAVAALLVPDLPVCLWWKDIPHDDDPLFDRLARMADRVVIDSGAFDHPYDDLARLAALIADPSLTLRATDLNWGRLTTWRMVLASFWDVPGYRPLLDRIDRITIVSRRPHEAMDEVAPRALLLAGWLASRLGWDVADLGADGTRADPTCWLRAGKREIALTFQQDSTSGRTDGGLVSITLSADGGGAVFRATRAADDTRIATEARIGTEETHARVLAHASRSDADRLYGELAIRSRDAVFESAVAHASQLIRQRPRAMPAPRAANG